MLSLLQSPRRRRRLAWGAGLAAVPLAFAALIVFVPNTAETLETPVQRGGSPATETAAVEPPLEVTPAVRRQVDRTVERFARTAMVRRNLDDAWALASPAMRTGLTYRQWLRGEIPVQPYPAKAFGGVDWRIVEAYPRGLLVDVAVTPKRGSGGLNLVYSVELRAATASKAPPFLVDAWVPLATLGGDPGSGERAGGRRGGRAEPAPLAFDDAKLGAEWFLVPAAIGGVLVFLLAGLALRGALVRRRAERRYREEFRG